MRRARYVVVASVFAILAACESGVVAPTSVAHGPLPAHSDAVAAPTLLLACPTTESQRITGVVGLLGGVLSLGGTSIDIPAGAVSLPTLFEIVVPPSPYMEVEIHAVGLTSFLFHKPASITLDYSRCGDDAP